MTVHAQTPSAGSSNDIEEPDISGLVTEDDTPVDNFASEKQQRLLTEPLYSTWSGPPPDQEGRPRRFIAAANVGLFATPKETPLVPDAFLSLDVALALDIWEKKNRTYLFWVMGKPPEVVIEVVSNREGNELGSKVQRYAQMRIAYYVVWDPDELLGTTKLHAFELRGDGYVPMTTVFFPSVGLGLAPWTGTYEDFPNLWLRWCTPDGQVVLTGAERAEAAAKRAEAEARRAEAEIKRAEAAQARAERLAAKLRALGIDPNGDG
nr:Uma2 family endonuclease [Polyangium aurulentum]